LMSVWLSLFAYSIIEAHSQLVIFF